MAITEGRFLVRFDNGILIDGSDTRVISGRDISRIRGIHRPLKVTVYRYTINT
jgi:hypothetical protein